LAFAEDSSPKDNYTDTKSLVDKATQLKLAESRQWQVLLHYAETPFWFGRHSLIDSPDFFLSENGKTDPQAELDSTIQKLFGAEQPEKHELRCRFPARYLFLREELLGEKNIDLAECAKLTRWLKSFENHQLTVVFASAFLNNPASMFGHTFLRLDPIDNYSSSSLLAYAISFAARTNEEKGPFFAAKGLTGFYRGSFGLQQYHAHVREYGDIDDRDLWEYTLNLSTTEVQRMLLHLWELQQIYFDYYFIDENCSYHLLSLIEAARPTLDLTSYFRWYAIPSDTLKYLLAQPSIEAKVKLRPSKSNRIRARATELSAASKDNAAALAYGEVNASDVISQQLNDSDKADILELSLDTVQYLKVNDPRQRDVYEKRELEILNAQNSLSALPKKLLIDARDFEPDRQHSSKRIALGYGYQSSKQYIDTEFRLAYHDQMDPAPGFPIGAELEFLRGSVRYIPDNGNVSIEEFTIADIFSRPVRDQFIKPLSWGARLGAKRRSFSKEEQSLVTEGQLKGGVSYEPFNKFYTSAFATGKIAANARLHDSFASAVGAELTFGYSFSEKLRFEIVTNGDTYLNGYSGSVFAVALEQQYTISKNLALVTHLKRAEEFGPSFDDIGLSLRSYF